MGDKFSFQVLREKDRLLYSAADVKRSITVKRTKTGSQRVSSRRSFFKPAPAESRAPNARPELEYAEIPYIQEQCDHLWAEVRQLEAEVAPLRARRDELEEELLERDRKEVRYNQAFNPDERQVSWARVHHRKAQDVLGARKERETVAEERKKLKLMIESENVDELRAEVERQRKEVLGMRRKARQKEMEIARVRTQAKEIVSSALFEDVQRQREEIVELRARVAGASDLHKQLKSKMEDLERMSFFMSEDDIENTSEVKSLKRNLQRALKRKKEKAKELRDLKKEHDEEEVTEMARNRQKKKKLRTIFAGLFDDEVTEDGMHVMFDQFGVVQSVSLGTREYKDKSYYCASIQYQNHEQAKLARKSMNGVMFREKPMKVLWNDESPTPPTEESRPSSVRRNVRVYEPSEDGSSSARRGRGRVRQAKSPLKVEVVQELDIEWKGNESDVRRRSRSKPKRKARKSGSEKHEPLTNDREQSSSSVRFKRMTRKEEASNTEVMVNEEENESSSTFTDANENAQQMLSASVSESDKEQGSEAQEEVLVEVESSENANLKQNNKEPQFLSYSDSSERGKNGQKERDVEEMEGDVIAKVNSSEVSI